MRRKKTIQSEHCNTYYTGIVPKSSNNAHDKLTLYPLTFPMGNKSKNIMLKFSNRICQLNMRLI